MNREIATTGPSRIRIIDAAMRLMQTELPELRQQDEQLAMCHDTILLNEALSVAHNAPDIRADRVASIRDRIARGEYEIDCERIAAGIIGENPGLFR